MPASRPARPLAGRLVHLAAVSALALSGSGIGALPAAAAGPTVPGTADSRIEALLAGARPLTIAGQRLDGKQIRRFYADQGEAIVWTRHPRKAATLWNDVRHADTQGLDPALFHLAAFAEHAATLSPEQRDVLLTGIFLSYADALAHGAMPPKARPPNQDLSPAPVDVVAALDRALTAADPSRAITALAPSSPAYEALRRAYLRDRAIAADSPVESADGGTGERTPRLQKTALQDTGAPASDAASAARRLRRLAVNLERLRWLPRGLPPERIVVNVATQELRLFAQNRPAFTTRVVVGRRGKQTPEFTATIRGVLFNPPWNVPNSILREEILPKLDDDPDYLAEHHMRWRGPMAVQQVAGPYSALGRIKFEMRDRFDVFLHDTPEKWRFRKARRLMSHGCVRVENPQALAALLLHQSRAAVQRAIDGGETHLVPLPQPVPVYIVYQTARVGPDGTIDYYPDVYHRDARIWRFLNQAGDAPLARGVGPLPPNG